MNQRLKTALLMGLVMIPILIFGHHYFIFSVFCLLLTIGAAYEFRSMLSKTNKVSKWIDILTIILTASLYFLILGITSYSINPIYLLLLLIGIILIYSVMMVFIDSFTSRDFGNALLTIFYCSIGFAAFAYLRNISLTIVLYLLIVVMITDTAAYFFGIRFGKHKIAPKVSPKKSVEGSVAGFLFGMIFGTLFGYFMNVFGSDYPLYAYIIISGLLSVIGQIGDLVASKFKRSYEIKDYSNLFPGHGGILDRFDSSMFAALHLLFILIFLGLF